MIFIMHKLNAICSQLIYATNGGVAIYIQCQYESNDLPFSLHELVHACVLLSDDYYMANSPIVTYVL